MRWSLPIALASVLLATPALAQEEGALSPRTPARIMGMFDVGYSAQSLFGALTNGAAFSGFVGVDMGSWDVSILELEAVPGRTNGGLSTLTLTASFVLEAELGRFRIGGGVRAGDFDVNRVTNGGHLDSAIAGVFGRFSVDVIQFDEAREGALYIVVRPGVDTMVTAPLFSGTVGVGVRF